MKIYCLTAFLFCLTIIACSSNLVGGPVSQQRAPAFTQSSEASAEVHGPKAVAVYKGFEYVFHDFDSGGTQLKIYVVVTNVVCLPSGECGAEFNGQSTYVGGTMVGYKQILELLSQCESHAASKVVCDGSINQFGAPNPNDFGCVASCR
ncbi:MAG: hypothetical protein ACXVA9_01925 [Bdellovibrionales bacterium]